MSSLNPVNRELNANGGKGFKMPGIKNKGKTMKITKEQAKKELEFIENRIALANNVNVRDCSGLYERKRELQDIINGREAYQ